MRRSTLQLAGVTALVATILVADEVIGEASMRSAEAQRRAAEGFLPSVAPAAGESASPLQMEAVPGAQPQEGLGQVEAPVVDGWASPPRD